MTQEQFNKRVDAHWAAIVDRAERAYAQRHQVGMVDVDFDDCYDTDMELETE